MNTRAVTQARTDLRPLANASADSQDSRIHRALKFLKWLRRPEDLPLIQAALRSRMFDVTIGLRSSYIPEKRTEITAPALSISSKIRSTADLQLAKWNRTPPADIDGAGSIYLGGLAGSLHFATPAGLKNSSLHLYLIPATNRIDELSATQFEHSFSYHFENPWNVETQLPFRIESVAPGNYRLIVIHDCAPPFGKDRAQFKPSPGDYTSSEIPITITPGKTTSDLHIDCKSKVEIAATKR